ncbi:hypothetical protein [Ureibacillus thermosphaericus]|uniref:hypothetical protein n=1 Tax=Ureibacillus thermosphaericus TaxID=51173 RepID=UPI001558F2FB|nr:hypothetical protein [Ureibacillus thermosphaericus]
MKFIIEHLPTTYAIVCTVFAFLVPFTVYKINEKIHIVMDPPWKQEERLKGNNEELQDN